MVQSQIAMIGAVQIGAERRAVARDRDRPAGQPVADEVADREVPVERQVRAHEREQPGDLDLQSRFPRVHRAQQLGRALALGVHLVRIQRVRRAAIVLAHVLEVRRLAPVHRARAHQQHRRAVLSARAPAPAAMPCTMVSNIASGSRAYSAASAEAAPWITCVKVPGGGSKLRTSPAYRRMPRPSGEMRARPAEALRIPRHHHRLDARVEPLVGPPEPFEQPGADEAGAAGDEHSRAAQCAPQLLGVRQDVRPVGLERLVADVQRRHHDRTVSTMKSSIGGVSPG